MELFFSYNVVFFLVFNLISFFVENLLTIFLKAFRQLFRAKNISVTRLKPKMSSDIRNLDV